MGHITTYTGKCFDTMQPEMDAVDMIYIKFLGSVLTEEEKAYLDLYYKLR